METEWENLTGFIEKSEDIFEGKYQFKQEENRILYPFQKIRCGGSNEYPQYFYSLYKISTGNNLQLNPKIV